MSSWLRPPRTTTGSTVSNMRRGETVRDPLLLLLVQFGLPPASDPHPLRIELDESDMIEVVAQV